MNVDQGFGDISSYGKMREEIEVLEDETELGSDLFFELLVAIDRAAVDIVTEDVTAYDDLSGINLFECCGAS